MDNKTYRYLQSFTRAYIASTSIPAPTGNAKVIASWPTKTKSTLTVMPLHSGPAQSYRVW
jgi:hypothetical protein